MMLTGQYVDKIEVLISEKRQRKIDGACMLSCSVVSNSLQPHGLEPTRPLCPWDSPGKNTGVGCHFLLQCIFPAQGLNPHLLHFLHCQVDSLVLHHAGNLNMWSVQFSSVTQSHLTLCDPMNHSTPGLPVHHQLPEFTQTHVHRVGDAIQPSHSLSSPSPPALLLRTSRVDKSEHSFT